ncbi:uroporphyrinogen-III synthase [Microbulbifer sp. CAU 1566]|uniref:uroporphyrinogen-III synthase n=1 Tax=Microbulbifer sp. CAU 1566 TaxID=2933269 RepID=UPI002003C430|nr:uroporphyrinogen-III synthase [Microbulbifer sp. CAU 1566]MCK7598814.1 uroporphyrinogen-III synthase [Microbulbifer sp. CAU 1566]
MSSPLQHQRILITRPAHQCGGWRDLLLAQGAEADCIPLLDIAPIKDGDAAQAIKSLIMDFDQFDHAIFVSQNAVQYAFDWLDDYWPQLPQGPRYYAIGAATARAIQNRGAEPETDNHNTSMDSEALLSLPGLRSPGGQRVIIFRGQGGRTLMGDTLVERGARLDYCELYQRLLPADAEEQLRSYPHTPQAITVHSGETLDNLQHALQASGRNTLRACPLICPSQRVASHAKALGFSHAYAASNASDSAMLAALKEVLAAGHS